MNRLNRLTAGLILAALITSSFASCSDADKKETTPNPSAGDTSTADTTPAEEETKDYIDEKFSGMNFNGEKFTILTLADNGNDDTPQFNHDDITGEPVDDAIYNQVTSVEEKLGVNVESFGSSDVSTDVRNASNSGDTTYKTVFDKNQGLANLVTQNLFVDLNQLQYIDFTQPWWNKSYKENLTIGGKTYCGFGDLFFEAGIKNVHLMYFNKELCGDLNIEYPYQAVYDGKWTLDYMSTMVEGAASDLNGDGKMDANDRWGLVQSPIQSAVFFYTGGFHVMSYDEEGYPYLDMYSEEFVNFYEKLFNLDYKNDNIWTNTQAQETDNFNMFLKGNVLLSSHFLTAVSQLREVEFEVGILPYPKYDEKAEYVNWPTGGNYLMAVPSVLNPDEYDFVGAVLEALSAQGYKFVRPALYEVTLQGKLARDKESQDMLDLIFDTMSVDFGWIHNGDAGLGWFVNDCLNSKLENISSYYNRVAKRAEKHYTGIVEYYRSME